MIYLIIYMSRDGVVEVKYNQNMFFFFMKILIFIPLSCFKKYVKTSHFFYLQNTLFKETVTSTQVFSMLLDTHKIIIQVLLLLNENFRSNQHENIK